MSKGTAKDDEAHRTKYHRLHKRCSCKGTQSGWKQQEQDANPVSFKFGGGLAVPMTTTQRGFSRYASPLGSLRSNLPASPTDISFSFSNFVSESTHSLGRVAPARAAHAVHGMHSKDQSHCSTKRRSTACSSHTNRHPVIPFSQKEMEKKLTLVRLLSGSVLYRTKPTTHGCEMARGGVSWVRDRRTAFPRKSKNTRLSLSPTKEKGPCPFHTLLVDSCHV